MSRKGRKTDGDLHNWRMNSNPAQGFVVHLQSRVKKAFISFSFQLEYFTALQPIKRESFSSPRNPDPKNKWQKRAETQAYREFCLLCDPQGSGLNPLRAAINVFKSAIISWRLQFSPHDGAWRRGQVSTRHPSRANIWIAFLICSPPTAVLEQDEEVEG